MGIAFFITLAILVVEAAGGIISNSLALLSDAGHVLTDVAAIGLSWYALRQARRPPSHKMTYGYFRTGILAAFINAVSLIIIALVIGWEAYGRLANPEPVAGYAMFISAAIGLTANLYMGLAMRDDNDLNVRSAVLHMLGDAAASAGVILGGVIIIFTGWYIVDPVLSLAIALLIAAGAWRLIKETVAILMEGTPVDISLEQVIESLMDNEGVREIHDIHVWAINRGKNALSCHVVVDGSMTVEEGQELLRKIEHDLLHLGINHTTIQFEDNSHPHEKQLLCSIY
ncbi:MAG: cation diffusion facilitator family transporter [Bacillota bacterium]